MALERQEISRTLNARAQLLRDDRAEILEGRERPMELLERVVGDGIAKTLNEELCVEDVLARRTDHRPGSGDAIRTPSIDRVPSTRSC